MAWHHYGKIILGSLTIISLWFGGYGLVWAGISGLLIGACAGILIMGGILGLRKKPFTGKDLYTAELLINEGFDKDLRKVQKESLKTAMKLMNKK